MCGIAGLIAARRVEPKLLARMADAIAHRGPDDHGVWSDPEARIGLAFRRLSILDLSIHGHQPMASANGRWMLCYNGEIYNHAAMRALLEAQGGAPEGGWRGHSDTETLVEFIAQWGLGRTLSEAVGMFAFALWDRRERKLRLVRDRFGEKPLYYGWAGRDFVFASELKAVRVHPEFDSTIDRRALHLYAARTHVPAPWSIHRGLFKLEPGTILTVPLDSANQPLSAPPTASGEGALRLTHYWSYREVVQAGLADPIEDEVEALDAVETMLGQAIRDQLVADVPVGAFLSGGIDSSLVVALGQKYSSRQVQSYSIGFDVAGYDEAHHAKAVAAHLGTEHHEHYVTVEQARDVIPSLPAIYDEPFADSSQIPTYLVSRFARRHITVALTGDGGDELFGGYNRHVLGPRLWNGVANIPRPLRALAGHALAKLPSSMWSGLGRMTGGKRQTLFAKLQRAIRVAGSARGLADVYGSFRDEYYGAVNPVIGGDGGDGFDLELAGATDAERMMYCDAMTYLPDDVLCKVDRASMAVSLETRVPFLDHRLAEVAARVPISHKIRNGRGKHILRELLAREVPRRLFERPKAGFAIPVGEWLRGPLRPWAEELLDPRKLAEQGFLDPALVRRRWTAHLAGKQDSAQALWAVLMFQAWRESSG